MQIDQSFLQDYLVQRSFVKPQLKVSNYALVWDEFSCGIPAQEVSELSAFLREILPYISGAFFKAAEQISRVINKEVNNAREAQKIHDSFSPQFSISYRKRDHEYILQMREDGTTTIIRNETVTTIAADTQSKLRMHRKVQMNFVLGEIVFIR